MTLVVDKFRTLLPPRTKTSPSGWLSFNAPCCHHRGHKPDTRKRAGVRFDGNGVIYNCFNCKFSTVWQPGTQFGAKIKSLCKWLGASDDDIKTLIFESLKTEAAEYQSESYRPKIEFTERDLPESAMRLSEWANLDRDEVNEFLIPIFDYLLNRGFDPLSDQFYWSPSAGYENRVIIPFWYQGKIVGNTARKITEGKPKYLSDQPPNFVFNFDRQSQDQKYVFVVEGPFDAISIGGVALLTNDISQQQARIINSLGAEVIVIPDQDQAGMNLIKRAIEHDWSVAFPNWDADVKDCADAVLKYGRLFTVIDAIKTKQQGSIKITMAMKQFEKNIKRLYN